MIRLRNMFRIAGLLLLAILVVVAALPVSAQQKKSNIVVTAGRAVFITGQRPFCTGLLRVRLPGAKQGLQDKDPTIAELLKP